MADRLLYSLKEAADALGMDVKTLIRNHIATGQLPYLIVGKRTKKITPEDLQAFIKERRVEACPSISARARRTGTTTSKSMVYDFAAAREQRTKGSRGR
jgi:hypothetical protein